MESKIRICSKFHGEKCRAQRRGRIGRRLTDQGRIDDPREFFRNFIRIGAAQSFKEFGDMVGLLLVGAITQWFGVRVGFVSCGAMALACLVLANFAAASPRGKIEVANS